jgi:hypothetical protein
MKNPIIFLLALLTMSATAAPVTGAAPDGGSKLIGMYIHQHWPYHYPYAARTWQVEDYRAYCGGLKKLGFNTVMIWPVLETMPASLTESDRASLRKLANVIDVLHQELGMRVFLTLCPNVGANSEEAAKASFEQRHFFYCDTRVNPADKEAMGKLIDLREERLRPLARIDGIVIIDSDPGGYPGSTNVEFVDLLMAHRRMLDRLRPGIELIYWAHVGWPAYGSWYQTGRFRWGTEAELTEAYTLLKKLNPEPWGLANGLKCADKLGLGSKVISFNYGSIEAEPSMPLTQLRLDAAYEAGSRPGPRGVMGNAQTHCLQLPNTFAFARGATGNRKVSDEDLVRFAEDLIPGHGRLIVDAWKATGATDASSSREIAAKLETLAGTKVKAGPLNGLLFNDPARFLKDLACMLQLKAAYADFLAASASGNGVKAALRAFADQLSAWQSRTGYENVWAWPGLAEALGRLHSPRLEELMQRDTLKPDNEKGATMFEKIASGFKRGETFTPELLQALQETADTLP